MNYFEIFGLPIQLKVDKKELPKNFLSSAENFTLILCNHNAVRTTPGIGNNSQTQQSI
jgi:hypothetical protein